MSDFDDFNRLYNAIYKTIKERGGYGLTADRVTDVFRQLALDISLECRQERVNAEETPIEKLFDGRFFSERSFPKIE